MLKDLKELSDGEIKVAISTVNMTLEVRVEIVFCLFFHLVGWLVGVFLAMTDFTELQSEQLVYNSLQHKSVLVFCSECFFMIYWTKNVGYYFG